MTWFVTIWATDCLLLTSLVTWAAVETRRQRRHLRAEALHQLSQKMNRGARPMTPSQLQEELIIRYGDPRVSLAQVEHEFALISLLNETLRVHRYDADGRETATVYGLTIVSRAPHSRVDWHHTGRNDHADQ